MATMERPRPSSTAAAPAPAPTATAPAPAAPAAQAVAASPAVPAMVEASPSTSEASSAISAPARAAAAAPARRAAALDAEERREANRFGELYSILVATEHLENAFVRGSVSNEDYDRCCRQLISQFKTLSTGLRDKCPDVKAWARDQGLSCPMAEDRLLGSGVPATTLYGGRESATGSQLVYFRASEVFTTLSDALMLEKNAVDELLPLVRDVQEGIVAIPNLPPLVGIDRIPGWLAKLNGMRASDRLDEDQCRQLGLDVEQAYTSLKNWLKES